MNIDSQSAAGEIPWGRSPFCFLLVVLLALMASSAQGQITPDPQTAPAAPASTAPATTDQAPGTPAPIEQVPGISTNADEVSLDLVVKDKKHNAILDLKPEDIEVTDNGTPVKLTGLHLVKADASTSHMTGRSAEAATILEDLVKTDPDWLDPHWLLAAVYSQLNRPEDGRRQREIAQQIQLRQRQAGANKK